MYKKKPKDKVKEEMSVCNSRGSQRLDKMKIDPLRHFDIHLNSYMMTGKGKKGANLP